VADYTFRGKSLHVDIHLIDGTIFEETFLYADSDSVPIDLTGVTAVVSIFNVDTGEVVFTADETSSSIVLGGALGTVTLLFTNAQIEALLNPCYKWDVKFDAEFRFLRGYIYRNLLR